MRSLTPSLCLLPFLSLFPTVHLSFSLFLPLSFMLCSLFSQVAPFDSHEYLPIIRPSTFTLHSSAMACSTFPFSRPPLSTPPASSLVFFEEVTHAFSNGQTPFMDQTPPLLLPLSPHLIYLPVFHLICICSLPCWTLLVIRALAPSEPHHLNALFCSVLLLSFVLFSHDLHLFRPTLFRSRSFLSSFIFAVHFALVHDYQLFILHTWYLSLYVSSSCAYSLLLARSLSPLSLLQEKSNTLLSWLSLSLRLSFFWNENSHVNWRIVNKKAGQTMIMRRWWRCEIPGESVSSSQEGIVVWKLAHVIMACLSASLFPFAPFLVQADDAWWGLRVISSAEPSSGLHAQLWRARCAKFSFPGPSSLSPLHCFALCFFSHRLGLLSDFLSPLFLCFRLSCLVKPVSVFL